MALLSVEGVVEPCDGGGGDGGGDVELKKTLHLTLFYQGMVKNAFFPSAPLTVFLWLPKVCYDLRNQVYLSQNFPHLHPLEFHTYMYKVSKCWYVFEWDLNSFQILDPPKRSFMLLKTFVSNKMDK